jgi:hypothetical protein
MSTSVFKTILSVFLSAILVGSIGVTGFSLQASAEETPYTLEPITPFQKSIQEMIQTAKNKGMKYPEVKYESTVEGPNALKSIQSAGRDLTETKIQSKTIVEFDGPADAGKDSWDNLVVESSDPAIRDQLQFKGNLTQMLIEKYPDLYGPNGKFVYGKEPRTLEVEETLTITEQDLPQEFLAQELRTNGAVTRANVVMGFTYAPPTIDYTIGFKWKVFIFTIAEGRAGFFLDAGLGLRLPANVELRADESLPENSIAEVKSSITPLDFSASQYEELGIPAKKGNEAFANFELFVGAKLTVIGIPIINWAIDEKLDLIELCSIESGIDCGNFVTPFGKDENGVPREFPVPEVKLDPDVTKLRLNISVFSIGVGLKLDPEIGSDKITANWQAADDASGKGIVTYLAASPTDYTIGPIEIQEVSDSDDAKAQLVLDNFKLHLNRQTITVGANIQLSFLGIGFFKTGYFDLLRIDLTKVLGEPAIGQHKGTDGLTAFIPIANSPQDNELFCGRTISEFTIVGSSGADNLTGTSAPDAILGPEGDDKIIGFAGDDFICAGPGNDIVLGGLGDDELSGGRGDDTVSAGLGDDIVLGGTGWDVLSGGRGNDKILGESGNDTLTGGWGNDTLDGNEGSDKIDGGKDIDQCANAEIETGCE